MIRLIFVIQIIPSLSSDKIPKEATGVLFMVGPIKTVCFEGIWTRRAFRKPYGSFAGMTESVFVDAEMNLPSPVGCVFLI